MKKKTFLKFFILFFFISFLIINWNQVSWVFNYQAISGLAQEYFIKKDAMANISQTQETDVLSPSSKKENILEISKIDISVPLIFLDNADSYEIEKALDSGTVHFFDSALPGEQGQTIVLGHSAPLGWPKIRHDWVFTEISSLERGDKISVYFENKELNYFVINKYFLERGEDVPDPLPESGSSLILISCWPPGKDIRRIAVEAVKEEFLLDKIN